MKTWEPTRCFVTSMRIAYQQSNTWFIAVIFRFLKTRSIYQTWLIMNIDHYELLFKVIQKYTLSRRIFQQQEMSENIMKLFWSKCQGLSFRQQLIIWQDFCRKLHKNERNWTESMVRFPRDTPLDPPNQSLSSFSQTHNIGNNANIGITGFTMWKKNPVTKCYLQWGLNPSPMIILWFQVQHSPFWANPACYT